MNKSIENARRRIEDSGFSVADADKRNRVEKFLNLPEKQNAFFDVLEILGRPLSGVTNALHESSQGGSAGQGFVRGLTGKDRTRGSDLVEDMGIENKAAKAILGTGLDIALDPLTYVPGGVIAKGVSVPARGFAKYATKAYQAVEKKSPKLEKLRTETIQPAAERAKDTIGRMFVPNYKLDETLQGTKDDTILRAKQETENKIRYQTEESAKDISDSARLAGGIDKGIETGRIIEAPLRQFEDVKAYEFPDGLQRTENRGDLLAEVGRTKSAITDIGKEIKTNDKEFGGAISEFARGLDQTDAEIQKLFAGLERQAGKDLDAATRANMREAGKELRRVTSQINNYDGTRNSLVRQFKNTIREQHDSKFDLVRQVRATAPNGVKGVNTTDLPAGIVVREGGKGIDEVADELGYQYADDLVQDLKRVKDIPRRLDNDTLETMARTEMERSGALKYLDDTFKELQVSRETLIKSLKDMPKTAAKGKAAKTTEKAFMDLEKDPRYIDLIRQREALKGQLDALRGESKADRQGKLDQIKALEDEIESLREVARNPVMVQKEIPRPERELSTDPAVNQAARNLVRSNAAIRQLALDNDISINEIEGYMTHVLAREERKRRANMKAIDRGNRGTGSPSKGVIKERTLTGSAEDVNDRLRAAGRLKEDENFFEPNAFFATAIGQKRLIEYIHSVNFRRQVLTNPNFARKYEKGMEIPNNAVVIDTANYRFMKDVDDMPEVVDEIGGQYIVTKSVKQALDRYQKLTTDEGVTGFLKVFDTLQSGWKRLALFSLPYHLRNDVGAKFNNWVGGMSSPDIAKYSAQADVDVYNAVIKNNESPLYKAFREQGLGSSGLSAVEFARRGQEPEDAIRKTIEKRSQFDGTLGGRLKAEVKSLKNPLNAFETSRQFGDFIDQTNRFALFKWFVEKNKEKYATEKELYEAAAKKVREVQFDYSNLTPFEQEFASRVIPFYRWMRNNIPFQIKQFINDPRKYVAANKLRLNAQDAVGLNEEELPDWMKEQFAFPVTGDGNKGKFVALNLPLGDLTKLASPLKMGIDSLSPVLKTPIEVGMNRNFFFDKPIEKFEGQEKQFAVPSNILGLNIPGGGTPLGGIDATRAYVLESLGGQPVRQLSNFFMRAKDADQDSKFRDPGLGISSFLKPYDAEQARYFQALDELRKLQDLMNYIEQQTGERPRTLAEINRR
ncbi:hypothetical protein ACI5FR_22885 [Paenibacillus sp. HJGM_3]